MLTYQEARFSDFNLLSVVRVAHPSFNIHSIKGERKGPAPKNDFVLSLSAGCNGMPSFIELQNFVSYKIMARQIFGVGHISIQNNQVKLTKNL